MRKPGYKRQKWLAILRLPCRGECAHGTAVKAAHGCDDRSAAGQQARKLERAFDRLGTGVAQEQSTIAWQRVKQLGLIGRALIIREDLCTADQPLRLCADCCGDGLVPVTKIGRPLTTGTIDILAPI